MSSRGWISVHRKIINNPVFQDPYLFKLWMYCLLKASHKEHKQLVGKEIVTLQEGQFIWGRNEAANELNHGTRPKEQKSPSTWERYLKLLEELEMLNRITNNKYTIVNIVNWSVYQDYKIGNEQDVEQQMNNERTADEQQVNTNNNVNNANNVNKYSSTTTDAQAIDSDAIVFYQNNIGLITPSISNEMLIWINDFGDEMVIEALRRSINRNKASWGYALSILRSWSRKNIKTIEQAKAEEIEFQNQQQSRYGNKQVKQRSNEVIPDWFENREDVQQATVSNDANTNVVEMEKILEKYRKEG